MQQKTQHRLADEVIAQYLIAEFEALHQRSQAHEQFIVAKTNFFIALTTAVLGGFLLLFQEYVDNLMLSMVIVAALLFLVIVGWTVFKQSVDLEASIAIYYRRAGRVRQWFVDNAPGIEAYIPFTVADSRPPLYVSYAPLRNLNVTVVSINAGLLAILGSYILFFFLRTKFSPLVLMLLIIGVSAILFVAMFYLQFRVHKKHLLAKDQYEKENGNVHFPHPH
jgi:hypothetical protein